MKTIIFDLDGTLADLTHRLHHVKNGKTQWDQFFAACSEDAPIKNLVALARMLYGFATFIIVSGRSDQVRQQTVEWLAKHGIEYHQLIMRKAGDYRPDQIIKEEILDQLLAAGHEIMFTVDDRQRVVDMWRHRGITCLQCAAWDEEGKVAKPSKKGLLTLMVGPSGAGKSTWLHTRKEDGNKECWNYGIIVEHIISSDQIRADLCGNFKDQTKNKEVFAALHALAKTRLDHGLPTVIDATHIKKADRLASVKLADGGPVRYIVIDRPMDEKKRDGEWRNKLGFDLLKKHADTFQSQLKDILSGDGLPNVEVIDLRK